MIWLLISLYSIICCESIQTGDKLIHAQVIIRNGDRNILRTFPNDPYKDKVHWPEGFGQLTNQGKRREYQLGKFLHRRYKQFLGAYSPDKMSILSSDFDRTINSANLVLVSMFPPNYNQIWNEHLLWQPIAVHSIPHPMDYYIYAETACARYVEARKKYEESPDIQKMIEQHRELFEYLEFHSGQPVRTLKQLKDIHEALEIEFQTNKTLPEWTNSIFIPGGAFENLRLFYIKFITGTPGLKKLKAGFILKELLDRFRNKTLSLLPDELMRFYSGHEITIASILNSLDIFELYVPPYGSSLLFELYESKNSHYMQLFYRNSTEDDLQPLNLPNCGIKCTLDQMYHQYQHILASDFERECRLPSQ